VSVDSYASCANMTSNGQGPCLDMTRRGSSSLRFLSPIEGMQNGALNSRKSQSPCLQLCSRLVPASPSPSEEEHQIYDPECRASTCVAELHEVGDLMNASHIWSSPQHQHHVLDCSDEAEAEAEVVTTPKHRGAAFARPQSSPPCCSGALSPPVSDARSEWKICGPQEAEQDASSPPKNDILSKAPASSSESSMRDVRVSPVHVQGMTSSHHDDEQRGDQGAELLCMGNISKDMDNRMLAGLQIGLPHHKPETTESTTTIDMVRFFFSCFVAFFSCLSSFLAASC
jgi:hypothetical protein